MKKLQWLGELHRQYYGVLLQLARKRLYAVLGTAQEAEDVVQEAFLLAGEKDIHGHPAPQGWLIRTTEHLCRQRIDRAIRAARRQGQAAEPQVAPAQEQPTDLLNQLRQQLKAEDWALLRGYCLEGKSAGDLAAERGCSANAVRVQIHRIRQRLKKNHTYWE